MPGIRVVFEGDGAHRDLAGKPDKVIWLGNDSPDIVLSMLEQGMKSGLPSMALRLDLPDGRSVMAETSARLFCATALMILSKHPKLLVGPGSPLQFDFTPFVDGTYAP